MARAITMGTIMVRAMVAINLAAKGEEEWEERGGERESRWPL